MAEFRITDTRPITEDELFSVYQFFPDGQYEKVREHVNIKQAMDAARHYCTCVAARIGTTVEVIICDGEDLRIFEWKFGQGVTFPQREQKE